jgi:hypothetical protein
MKHVVFIEQRESHEMHGQQIINYGSCPGVYAQHKASYGDQPKYKNVARVDISRLYEGNRVIHQMPELKQLKNFHKKVHEVSHSENG